MKLEMNNCVVEVEAGQMVMTEVNPAGVVRVMCKVGSVKMAETLITIWNKNNKQLKIKGFEYSYVTI